MKRWTDYGISTVKFNDAHTHINKIRVHHGNDDTIGKSVEHTRADVIAAIKKGITFVTIFKGNDENWKKGQSVYIVKITCTR